MFDVLILRQGRGVVDLGQRGERRRRAVRFGMVSEIQLFMSTGGLQCGWNLVNWRAKVSS
jgi:hypothetical protein